MFYYFRYCRFEWESNPELHGYTAVLHLPKEKAKKKAARARAAKARKSSSRTAKATEKSSSKHTSANTAEEEDLDAVLNTTPTKTSQARSVENVATPVTMVSGVNAFLTSLHRQFCLCVDKHNEWW